jgi:hypothetical protein
MTKTNNSQTDNFTAKCVARRHIDAAAFKTYDAMMAVVMAAAKKLEAEGKWKTGSPLPTCFVSAMQLANMNNRSKNQEVAALAKLEHEGWIVRTHEEQRRFRGRMSSNEYRVLTHEDFLAANPKSCPPARYVIVDDKHTRRGPAKAGQAPWALERYNITKSIGIVLPDRWLAAIAGVRKEKAMGIDTGTPVTVADYGDVPPPPTVTGNPVSDTPRQEIPYRTVTGNPVTTVTGNPVSDRDRKSCDKALDVQPEKTARNSKPANQPTSENGGTGGLDVYPSFLSLKDKDNSQEDDQWIEFLKQVKDNDDLRNWVLYGETKDKVRKAVMEHGAEAIFEALDDWKENRRPPVSGLDYPWQVFLRECEDEIKAWSKAGKRWKR